MTPELYNIQEGPAFSILWAPVFLLSVIWIASHFIRTTSNLSDLESSGIGTGFKGILKNATNVLFASLNLFFVGCFLLISGYLDAHTSNSVLISYSILCWVVFGCLIWSLSDAIYALLRRFRIDLRTPLKEFDIVLGFFIGSRTLFILTFLLGLLNFPLRLSFTLVSIFALMWGTYRLLSLPSLKFAPPPKKSHDKKQVFLEKTSSLAPLILVSAIMILIWKYNTYVPMTSWDHFSQWLIVPHEMLFNDQVVGLYDTTRSISPGYPPQQTVEGTFLLWLWGDINLSETILSLYAPIMFAMVILLITGLCRMFGLNVFGCLTIALVLILASSYSSSIYRNSFYGDARLALALLVMVSSLVFISNQPNKRDAVFLAIAGAALLTVKPYAWPLAALAGGTIFLLYRKWSWLFLFIVTLTIQFFLETAIFQSIVPDSQIIDRNGVGGRIGEVINSIKSLDFSRIITAYKMRDGNILNAILVGSISILSLLAAIFSKSKPLTRLAAVVGLTGFAYLTLSAMITQFNPVYGNSLARYLANTMMVMSLGIGILITAIYQRLSIKPLLKKVGISVMALSTVAGLVLLYQAPPKNGFKWYEVRKANLSRFPLIFSKFSYLAQDLQEIDGPETQKVLIFPRQTRLEKYAFNYHLARTTKSVVSYPLGGAKDEVSKLLSDRGAEILSISDIDWLYLIEPQTISDQTLDAGLYSKSNFIELLEQNTETSKKP